MAIAAVCHRCLAGSGVGRSAVEDLRWTKQRFASCMCSTVSLGSSAACSHRGPTSSRSPPGKMLCSKGETAHEFFVIEDGTAKVVRDGQYLDELGPGDFFGEMGLLDERAAQRRRGRQDAAQAHGPERPGAQGPGARGSGVCAEAQPVGRAAAATGSSPCPDDRAEASRAGAPRRPGRSPPARRPRAIPRSGARSRGPGPSPAESARPALGRSGRTRAGGPRPRSRGRGRAR